jgi:hypothetical protein
MSCNIVNVKDFLKKNPFLKSNMIYYFWDFSFISVAESGNSDEFL